MHSFFAGITGALLALPCADEAKPAALQLTFDAVVEMLGDVMAYASCGTIIKSYDNDPNRRVRELLNDSEDLRKKEYEWERIWFNDEPSHLTPDRVHGGIQ